MLINSPSAISVQSPPVAPAKEPTALSLLTNTKETANLSAPEVVTDCAAIVLDVAYPKPPPSATLEVATLRKAYILAILLIVPPIVTVIVPVSVPSLIL